MPITVTASCLALPSHNTGVHNASSANFSQTTEVAREGGVELGDLVLSQARTITAQRQQIDSLKHQLAWFQRQVFGRKSERFAPELDPTQMHLGEVSPVPALVPETTLMACLRAAAPGSRSSPSAPLALLALIYEAQFASIRTSRVKAMDETPIKAGRADRRCRAHQGWLRCLQRQCPEDRRDSCSMLESCPARDLRSPRV